MVISDAAKQNWRRLHPDLSLKLKKRANKTLSGKRVFPREYITKKETYSFLKQILDLCLKEKISTLSAIYSLALKLLKTKGIAEKNSVRQSLREYQNYPVNRKICSLDIPGGEKDILGIVYQSLLTEGEKNTAGSYYTPFSVIARMMKGFRTDGRTFLDPCCGSGAFLLSLSGNDPGQLWGCDKDPVAVLIAKVNLLCKYPSSDFIPHIFCCDYLAEPDQILARKRFDFIATNPPWGAKSDPERKRLSDSFSLFFRKAYTQLRDGGKICFLFPEAVLNIRAHERFREMLLTETCIRSIFRFQEKFTGVMTGYVAVEAEKAPPKTCFLLKNGKGSLRKKIKDILAGKEKIISFLSEEENKILSAMDSVKKYDLSGSIFAMGIVTGNNQEKVKPQRSRGMEPVFTGKEIGKYVLKQAENYIRYQRKEFQQTAKDEYYRAPEKLVYKFISKRLVFAYDNTRSLFLNSANLLIPALPGYSIKTVLAFLNSEPLQYYYQKRFDDVKILKNNLLQLPFPEISGEINEKIGTLMEPLLQGDPENGEALQKIIFDCYHLTAKQISTIRKNFRSLNE